MPFTVRMRHHVMRHDNACRIVANSSLMTAVVRQYGPRWEKIGWVRAMLAGFVGALEGASELDPVLDEMRDMAGRIRNGTAAV